MEVFSIRKLIVTWSIFRGHQKEFVLTIIHRKKHFFGLITKYTITQVAPPLSTDAKYRGDYRSDLEITRESDYQMMLAKVAVRLMKSGYDRYSIENILRNQEVDLEEIERSSLAANDLKLREGLREYDELSKG